MDLPAGLWYLAANQIQSFDRVEEVFIKTSSDNVTQLLLAWGGGDPEALEQAHPSGLRRTASSGSAVHGG